MPHVMEEDKIVQTIAENIRESRTKKRMTQLEVAEDAELSVNHYAKIERGEVEPGEVTLIRIIQSLGAEYKDILPKL